MTHSLEYFLIPENTKIEVLQKKFCDLFDESKKTEARKLFKKIIEKYQAKNREYHNFEHIAKMLVFLQSYDQEIKDGTGIKLATYFHDIIYNTKAKDNEEQSAQYAQYYLTQLGIPEDVIAHISALIRATLKHEIIKDDTDSAFFLDADLAILGTSEKEYAKYATKIRQEYAWVPNEEYKAGRIKILKSFLERPQIYFTERASKELEQQARVNIEKEIAELS